jgi:hypothetical protein
VEFTILMVGVDEYLGQVMIYDVIGEVQSLEGIID